MVRKTVGTAKETVTRDGARALFLLVTVRVLVKTGSQAGSSC
jgi:hypothetical protein